MWRALACLFCACAYTAGKPAPTGAAADAQLGDAPAMIVDAQTTGADAPADAPETNVFTIDANVLALFELNGDLKDTSGNGRDATLIGGTFVPTSWGMGFKTPG